MVPFFIVSGTDTTKAERKAHPGKALGYIGPDTTVQYGGGQNCPNALLKF